MKQMLSIFILVFIPLFCAAQNYVEEKNGQFYYEGIKYNKHALDSIIMQSSEGYALYTLGVNNERKGNINMKVGALMSAPGLYVMLRSLNPTLGNTLNSGTFRNGTIIFLSGLGISLYGSIKKYNGTRKIRNGINHFNWEKSQGIIYLEEQPHLDFSISNNGIGLFYIF